MQAKIDDGVLMDMLVVNGEIRHMARFPNFDADAVRFNGTSAEATSPERVMKWKHPETGFLHAMHQSDWGDFHYRITGRDDKGNLTLEGGWQNNRQSGLHPENRMVENILRNLMHRASGFTTSRNRYFTITPCLERMLRRRRLRCLS